MDVGLQDGISVKGQRRLFYYNLIRKHGNGQDLTARGSPGFACLSIDYLPDS